MSNVDFANGMLRLKLAIDKELSAESLMVYWELLCDLPAESYLLGIDRVILEHRWNTFPSIAEIRKASVESSRGEIRAITSAEAWNLAWKAACRIDLEVPVTIEKEMGKLPPLVAECLNRFGITAIVGGKEPVAVIRAQFLRFFEELQERDERKQLFTPAIIGGLKAIRESRPEALRSRIESIGRNIE